MTIWKKAFLGSLEADALAMPVHWYYDRQALRWDYGKVDKFLAPKNPHPDSILYRSKYRSLNAKGDILGEQAKYWGQRGIHYHQFLAAGENTLNFKLAGILYEDLRYHKSYDEDRWLTLYIDTMLHPERHRDTYIEEYHRAFFLNYAKGKEPRECGISDEHIGGLAMVPALLAGLEETDAEDKRKIVRRHVQLTHRHDGVLHAADTLARILIRMDEGLSLPEAMSKEIGSWVQFRKLESLLEKDDHDVIGPHFSPACYIKESFPASLYLALKYHDSYKEGLIANAMVGGDSCHRGAVVGALLGAAAKTQGCFGELKNLLDQAEF